MKENNTNNNGITRQEFLKRMALAGAGLLVTSLKGLTGTTADKKIRVAVIGCGSVSNAYLPQLLSSKDVVVVSLCDIKYERALAQNKRYEVNAKTYPNPHLQAHSSEPPRFHIGIL